MKSNDKKYLKTLVIKYFNNYGRKCKYNPNEVVGFMIDDSKIY